MYTQPKKGVRPNPLEPPCVRACPCEHGIFARRTSLARVHCRLSVQINTPPPICACARQDAFTTNFLHFRWWLKFKTRKNSTRKFPHLRYLPLESKCLINEKSTSVQTQQVSRARLHRNFCLRVSPVPRPSPL